MKWCEYYSHRIGKSYQNYCSKRYEAFISKILKYNPKTILEEGCGIGTISVLLKQINSNLKINGFDIDEIQVKNAILNSNSNIDFFTADIKNYQPSTIYDIIFSHGVLEHFNDIDIQAIINRQRKYAKTIIHYIPTNKYNYKSFGDERLLSVNYWKNITKAQTVLKFNKNKDLMLVLKGEKE